MKKRDYAPSAQKMAGHEQIAAEVGKNANGVGYVGLAYMKAGGIKVVPLTTNANPGVSHRKEVALCRPTFYTPTAAQRGGERISPVHHQPGRAGNCRSIGFVPIKAMK